MSKKFYAANPVSAAQGLVTRQEGSGRGRGGESYVSSKTLQQLQDGAVGSSGPSRTIQRKWALQVPPGLTAQDSLRERLGQYSVTAHRKSPSVKYNQQANHTLGYKEHDTLFLS